MSNLSVSEIIRKFGLGYSDGETEARYHLSDVNFDGDDITRVARAIGDIFNKAGVQVNVRIAVSTVTKLSLDLSNLTKDAGAMPYFRGALTSAVNDDGAPPANVSLSATEWNFAIGVSLKVPGNAKFHDVKHKVQQALTATT